jgi:hypothetical protein
MPEGYLDCKVIINIGQEGPDSVVRVRIFNRIIIRINTIDSGLLLLSDGLLRVRVNMLDIFSSVTTIKPTFFLGGDFGVEGSCVCSKGKEGDGDGSLGKHVLFKLVILIISLIRAFQVNENHPIKVTEIDALNSKDRVF